MNSRIGSLHQIDRLTEKEMHSIRFRINEVFFQILMLTYHNVWIERQIGIVSRKRAVLKNELEIDDICYAVNAIKFK